MKTKTTLKKLSSFKEIRFIQLLVAVILGAALFISSPAVFSAQLDKTEPSSDKKIEQGLVARTEPKVVQGELIGFVPKDNPIYIGIAVEKDNTDYYLVLDQALQVNHKKDLSELVIGDTIRVDYDEITESSEEGKEKSKRVAKTVTFVKQAPAKDSLVSNENNKE